MDKLKTMDSFVWVAKSGSFSAAADRIGCSRALVTKQIMELEKRLGARLLNRTTRTIALTEIGREYLDFCLRIQAELGAEEAIVDRLQKEPHGALRLCAPKSFGSMHFADCVAQFALACPNLKISLMLDDSSARSVNFAQSECDVMIRLMPLRDSTVTARKIGALTWIVCASPAYLRQHGAPHHPRELIDANCLVHPKLAPNREWRFAGSNVGSVKVSGSFSSNSAVVLRRAALAGVGIAQLPLYRVAEDIDRGSLIQLLPAYPLVEHPIYAVYPASHMMPAKVKLFLDFFAKWFHETRPCGVTLVHKNAKATQADPPSKATGPTHATNVSRMEAS